MVPTTVTCASVLDDGFGLSLEGEWSDKLADDRGDHFDVGVDSHDDGVLDRAAEPCVRRGALDVGRGVGDPRKAVEDPVLHEVAPGVVPGTGLDGSIAGPVPRGLRQRVADEDRTTKVDQPEDEEKQDRQGERELDQRLAAGTITSDETAHQWFTTMVVVRQGRTDPVGIDCEATT